MVARHPLDVGEGLLGGGDQLRPPLLQPPLVLVLLVEPFIVREFLLTKSRSQSVHRGAHSGVTLAKDDIISKYVF